jgi:lipoprotein-anchoring transpeptidase ErfK/SrfK
MLRLLAIGGTALAALVTVTAAAADGSRLSARATVDVVGAGSLVWPHVGVRSRPSRAAPMVKSLGQFIAGFRPRTVLALRELRDATGKPTWYRVTVPGRPNGRTGWIPAASVSLQPVDRWLVIFRGDRRFEFVLRGRVVRSGPVAIGAPGMPTPLGLFYVQVAYRPVGDPILGAWAFETSAYSRLSDWPGGGIVGVHGTNTPQLIGQAVSHGCVRMRNADIEYLRSFIRLGTPVKIVA